MSKQEDITYNDDVNSYEFYNADYGIIEAKCGKWANNCFGSITITKNTYNRNGDGFRIIRVDMVKSADCSDSPKLCNELHIKGIYGNNNAKSYEVRNMPCDLQHTNVKVMVFSDDEFANGEHMKIQCRNCYPDGSDKPDIKDGNVIVGKN